MDQQNLKISLSIPIPEDMILITKVEYENLQIREQDVLNRMSEFIPKRYLNQKEVCKYTGKSPKTINQWVKKGMNVIITEEGSNPIYDIKDVDTYLEEHKTKDLVSYIQKKTRP